MHAEERQHECSQWRRGDVEWRVWRRGVETWRRGVETFRSASRKTEQPFQAQSVSHRTDYTSLESKRTPRDFPRLLFLYPLPSAAARTAPNGVKERASFCLVFRSLNTTSSHRMFSMGYRRAKSTQGNTKLVTNIQKRIFLANNFGITTRGP